MTSFSSRGTAEKDVRAKIVEATVKYLGQPELTEEFCEWFKAKVPPAKQYHLDTVGITEWIIISNPLAKSLQKRFREVGIWQQHHVPSGGEFTRTLTALCHEFSLGKAPSQDRLILGSSGK